MLDAYPPKMHGKTILALANSTSGPKSAVFDPEMLCDVQYRHLCLQSLTETYDDHDLVQQLDVFIRSQLVQLHSSLIASGKPALQIYREKVASLDIGWAQMKSNETCFC